MGILAAKIPIDLNKIKLDCMKPFSFSELYMRG